MIQKMFLTDIYNFFKADGDVYETKTLVRHPEVTVFISIAYIVLAKCLIPWILEKRKPMEIKRTIVVYNLLVCLLNGILAYMAIVLTAEVWNNRCTVKNGANKQQIQRGLHITWYVWMVKHLELLDTVFFALRKKNNQITFLHLFHHCAMVLVFGLGLYLRTIAFLCLFGTTLNVSIHVVMYLYYGLASIGPRMQKYLWWKKYLTILQIAHFIVILSYAVYGFVTGCENFGRTEIACFISVTTILVLFINFYKKSYHVKNPHFNKKYTDYM
ncbi:very long chain fatty acid elongase 7-like [Parasteatoda tepidariorum]|uniref:very long chain fatty acid elongase 7-like n=1 Tax=Parasteatoda tepidariorum TaxID=114398 RepID=UPI001C7209E5|nr:elongation of very long chain fatty acids protein 7-like [Parasteatoda tepidariorum]